jgi:tetratricopeptide (TPR) repeat protein
MIRISIIILFAVSVVFAQVRDNPDRLYRLAQTYEQSGHYKEANQIYEKLYRRNPSSYSYFSGYTRTLTALKKYDEVIAICKEKLKRNPADINTYGLLGSVYYLKNEREKAYEVWDEAVTVNGGQSINYRIIANYAMQTRAFEKAKELLREGKRKSGSPELFSFDLANLYSLTMDYADATKEYCEILRVKPKQFYTVKNRIAALLTSESAQKEIITTLEHCSRKYENGKIDELLAYAYKETGEYDKALTIIKELDEKKGAKGKVVFSFANEALRNNNFEIAVSAFEYLLDEYRDAPYAEQAELGFAKAKIAVEKAKIKNSDFWKPLKKRVSVSPRMFERAVKILERLSLSNNYKVKHEARKMLAALYFSPIADYEKADSLYGLIIADNRNGTDAVSASIARGEIALLTDGDFAKAEKFFKTALNNKLKISLKIKDKAIYFLGGIKYWEADFSDAEKYFSKLAAKKTSDYSNDAIEKKLIISMFKNDSLRLARFSRADYFLFENDFDSARALLSPLAENKNLFILNNVAKLKIAEIFIAENRFGEAIKLLGNLVENNMPEIFPDRALKELGDVYFYGIKNYEKAREVYNKFLEKYPESLYINMIRENIKNTNKTEKDER